MLAYVYSKLVAGIPNFSNDKSTLWPKHIRHRPRPAIQSHAQYSYLKMNPSKVICCPITAQAAKLVKSIWGQLGEMGA